MDPASLDTVRIALDPAGQAGLALAVICIVMAVSLRLAPGDFRFLRERPRLFAGGVAAQILGLPAATFALVLLLAPPPSVALGMFVVAACPGGASSNFLTQLARGDAAYSVSLTTTSSVLAAALTPALILFWSELYPPTAALLDTLDFRPVAFLVQTALLLGAPLAAGMIVARQAPKLAARLRAPVAILGAVALGGVIVYGLVSFLPELAGALPLIGPIAILHNAVALGLGALAGWLLGAAGPARRALVFELGIQNSGLALIILLSQLQGLGGAAAIAAAWGVWHLIAGALIVLLYRALDRRKALA